LYTMKKACFLFLFGWLGLGWCGCKQVKEDKAEPAAPKSQLAYRAKMFNQFLRWRSYKRAKQLVAPGLRSKYMLLWEKERGTVNITEVDIRDITVLKSGSEAHVLVVHQRYSSNSPSLKRVVFLQKWVANQGVWFFVGKAAGQKKPKEAKAKSGEPLKSGAAKKPGSRKAATSKPKSTFKSLSRGKLIP